MHSVFFPDTGNSFLDVLDAQWECEGKLIPLDLSVLNPREFLVYQHGLFLMHKMHDLNLVSAYVLLLLLAFSTALLLVVNLELKQP